MTSRRPVPTYGQRVSRALQFIPGHVGGRVASAQPIRRRGGTLRRQSVGAAGAPESIPTCTNTSYVLTSVTATSATYVVDPVEAGEVPFLKRDFGVYVLGTLLATGAVDVWVSAIDADEPLSVPTAAQTLAGPGYDAAGDYIYITDPSTAGEVRGWTLSWDVPSAFSTLCCNAIYSE